MPGLGALAADQGDGVGGGGAEIDEERGERQHAEGGAEHVVAGAHAGQGQEVVGGRERDGGCQAQRKTSR